MKKPASSIDISHLRNLEGKRDLKALNSHSKQGTDQSDPNHSGFCLTGEGGYGLASLLSLLPNHQ